MRIKITINDTFLIKAYGVKKGTIRKVVGIRHQRLKGKDKGAVVGYYISVPILYECNFQFQFENIIIRTHECIVYEK